MTKSDIQSILGAKTVSFNSLFAKATGSVTAAVFLSQAVFWQEKAKFKGSIETAEFDGEKYFSKTGAEWYDETGLSAEQQKTARKPLVLSGILKEKRAGLPAKMFFRIDIEALVSGISAYLNTGVTVSGFSANRKPENPRTVSGKFRKQEGGKPESNNKVRELNESFESKGENNAGASAPLSPPFKKKYETIVHKDGWRELVNLYPEAEKENPTPPVPARPPAPAIVKMYDPQLDVTIVSSIPPQPMTKPETTGREQQKREQKEKEIGLATRVISYLNEKAGRSFRVNADANAKGIIARAREGFTEDEMRTVIDFKVAEWGKDTKFYQYLTPETLFRPSHFEAYLQAAKVEKPKSQQQSARSQINHFGGNDQRYDEKQAF